MSFLHPGQYISEIGSGVQIPKNLSTSLGILIGKFPRGTVGKPVLITSPDEFQDQFVGKDVISNLKAVHEVEGFFEEGGGSCYIIRVDGTSSATGEVTLASSSSPTYTIKAIATSKGSWSNGYTVTVNKKHLAVSSCSVAVSGTLTGIVNLNVGASDGWEIGQRVFKLVDTTYTYLGTLLNIERNLDGTLKFTFTADIASTVLSNGTIVAMGFSLYLKNPSGNTVEFYDKVAFEPALSNYYGKIINSYSKTIQISETGTVTSSNRILPLWGITDGTISALASGSDGTLDKSCVISAITDVLPQVQTMGNVAFAIDDFVTSDTDYQDIYRAAIIQNELSKKWITITTSTRSAEASIEALTAFRNLLPSSAFGILYQGLGEVYNKGTYQKEYMNMGCHLAGIYARVAEDAKMGYWFAPAGVDAAFRSISVISKSFTDTQQNFLNPIGVNCLRNFPGYGILPWGCRTLSNNSDMRYITDRLTFNYIEQTILASNLWGVFKPNDDSLGESLGLSIDLLCDREWRKGALKGSVKTDAYKIEFGNGVTTEADIQSGLRNIKLGLATQKPGEFINYIIYPLIKL